ncbi:hypothetical protein [Candidatus Sarmatiella mevalonica]|uniref:hypothetical protein n=1 Tax=Candidatus Sarmatiella mevalonica TaxID=2770581 RepID=UPI001922BB70|nr:hypothetical protein [Candidatus Sarmatiella mevalonica]
MSLILFGCAKKIWQRNWSKEGVTVQQRDEAIYCCLQKAQQSYKIGRWIVPSVSDTKTNEDLFTCCMKANGFSLVGRDKR